MTDTPPDNEPDPEATPPTAPMSPAQCAALLAERFPGLFGAGVALPVKLRIQVDLQERAPGLFTRKVLSGYLHRHTTSTAYLKALLASPHRFDLEGQPAGEISDEHRQAAEAELARRRELHQARRAAEREAQRATERAAREVERASRSADDEARRQRLALLRAWETTTLTPANFGALKGLTEEALQAQLDQAREDRARAPEPLRDERPQRPPGPRGDRRPAPDSRPASRRR